VNLLIDIALLLVAAAGTAVVLSRDAVGQALILAVFGLSLTVLALVLQAPDVALSLLVVGSAIVPMLVLLAVASGRKADAAEERT
jgi:uncharacterized MnhB-related membrane protein